MCGESIVHLAKRIDRICRHAVRVLTYRCRREARIIDEIDRLGSRGRRVLNQFESIFRTKAALVLVLAQPPAVEPIGILDENSQDVTLAKFELVLVVDVVVVESYR